MAVDATSLFLTLFAAVASVIPAGSQSAPAAPPNYPYRPPPLAAGATYVGAFGTPCYSKVGSDGSFYHDEAQELGKGRQLWLTVSSPDFQPTLTLFLAGTRQHAVLVLVASADGRRSQALFTASASGRYVIRTSAPPGVRGRFRTEIIYDGKRELSSEGHWTAKEAGSCR